MAHVRFRSYISGARWLGLQEAVYEAAVAHGLDFEVTDHTHGWINETIYFAVSGEEAAVRSFWSSIKAATCE